MSKILARQIGSNDTHIRIPDQVMDQIILKDDNGFVSGRNVFVNDTLAHIKRQFDRYYSDIKDAIRRSDSGSISWHDALAEIRYYIFGGDNYGPDEADDWKPAVEKYDPEHPDQDGLLVLLFTLTGKEYECDTAHGPAIDDLIYVYHPADWTPAEFRWFERSYWETGTQWRITASATDIQIRYYDECDPEKVKELIAEEYGAAPSDITMSVLDGYVTIPKYHDI